MAHISFSTPVMPQFPSTGVCTHIWSSLTTRLPSSCVQMISVIARGELAVYLPKGSLAAYWFRSSRRLEIEDLVENFAALAEPLRMVWIVLLWPIRTEQVTAIRAW
jgi:hypothetical protein